MNPIIFTKQIIKDVTVLDELKDFIINTKFSKSNYQLTLMRSVLENQTPISKDDIVLLIQKMNPDQKDLTRLKKNCDNSVFRNMENNSRTYFKNQWVIFSECKKWLKFNIEITKEQKTELINLINNRLTKGDL